MGKRITHDMFTEALTAGDKLKEQIERHEGFRDKPYKCPAGKLTIGYGFNIEDQGLPKKVADFWLEHILGELEQELGRAWTFLPKGFLNYARTYALLNMAYNLGVPRLLQFKKMFAAIEAEDYELAAKEMLSSKWANQVGNRAVELAEQMRTGEWQC